MTRSVRPVLALVLAGCGVLGGSGVGAPAGELELRWEWARQGALRAPVTAQLCAETGLVELVAVRGDSGGAVVFFPVDSASLDPASYPVFLPSQTPEPRPGVLVALRWFEHDNIFAWYGSHGTVRVESGGGGDGGRGGGVAGSLDLVMVLHDGFDSLRVTGRFSGVRVDRGVEGCGAGLRRDYR